MLASHERLLGRRAANVIFEAEAAGLLDLSRLDPALQSLLERRDCFVAVTTTGICGDSGAGNQKTLLLLEGPDRERLMRSDDAYRSAVSSREVLAVASRYQLSGLPFLMTPCVGLDNRELLPPFFPLFRNSDGLFGRTLRAFRPEALIGRLPIAVAHFPPEGRRYHPEAVTDVSCNAPELMELLIRSFGKLTGSYGATQRLDAFGRYFEELGALAPPEFSQRLSRPD